MNLKDRIIFLILSFGITTVVLSYTGNYPIQFITPFNLAFAVSNEAEVNTEIEQENKCKKDTECENENELNNSLKILNEETGQTGTGQLTVFKEVTCTNPVGGGSLNTFSQEQSILTKIQFVPIGPIPTPCIAISDDIQPEDFIFTVTGNNPNPSNFPGSNSGVVVTLGEGPYDVEEDTSNIPQTGGPFQVKLQTTETGDCSGTILSGESKTCTFTNHITFELPQGP